jgi:SAM-dependent methyltransferase
VTLPSQTLLVPLERCQELASSIQDHVSDRKATTAEASAALVYLWHHLNAPLVSQHLGGRFVEVGAQALWELLSVQSETGRSLLKDFPLDARDGCINLFGLALRSWQMPVKGKMLEIGCAEADWVGHALKADPTLEITGVDWRKRSSDERWTYIQGDIRDASRFEPNSFDWVISISAIEHIGLGHYDRDPKDEWGDVQTMHNVLSWLKPGGSFYFDVPYNPERYVVEGTSHREYDDKMLRDRLFVHGFTIVRQGYTSAKKTDTWVDKPAERGERMWYVANWWVKA